jgi:hypothetical protein
MPEDWAVKRGKRRYVFVDALSPKVRQLSVQNDGSLKIYNRFYKTLFKESYNQETIHGLRAIDIDQPQKPGIGVPVRLEIIVGEGTDSYERVWSS